MNAAAATYEMQPSAAVPVDRVATDVRQDGKQATGLASTSRADMTGAAQSSEGTLLRELSLTLSDTSTEREPSVVGTEPVKLLEYMWILVSLLRLPSSRGIVPADADNIIDKKRHANHVSTAQHNTAQHGTAQYSTRHHCAAHGCGLTDSPWRLFECSDMRVRAVSRPRLEGSDPDRPSASSVRSTTSVPEQPTPGHWADPETHTAELIYPALLHDHFE
jgi:hypothetical protein